MEAVAGRAVMIAEPVQRLAACDGRTANRQGDGGNVLLLIDEHSGEAPIVIGQRVPLAGQQLSRASVAPPGGGGRALSKTRQQLELLCAAADYATIGQQGPQGVDKAIILAPVVVGRRSHRLQQQQQLQEQQRARYLFGEFAPELGAGVELRQHVLRPIGVLEPIPVMRPDQAAMKMSSDASRRSISSASSSSAASSRSNSTDHHRQHQHRATNSYQPFQRHDSTSALAEYHIFEATKFSPVPEYDHDEYAETSRLASIRNINEAAVISPQSSSNKKLSKKSAKAGGTKSAVGSSAPNNCDNPTYCCSDPNCGFLSSPAVNYSANSAAPGRRTGAPPLMRSVPCQKIELQSAPTTTTACCGSANSNSYQLVDHRVCQANSHPHPSYLPPLNSKQRLVATTTGTQHPASHSSPSDGSQASSDLQRESIVVEQMYESLAAELKAKLGNLKVGPILFPPRDYDTLCRKQGKLDGIELRRSTNPQLVGPTILPDAGPTKRSSNDSSSSGNSSLKSND